MLSAVFVEAEGEGVQIGVLGAVSVCITVSAEGEGVEQGVLCAVTVVLEL